jgi:hypothetical protein
VTTGFLGAGGEAGTCVILGKTIGYGVFSRISGLGIF